MADPNVSHAACAREPSIDADDDSEDYGLVVLARAVAARARSCAHATPHIERSFVRGRARRPRRRRY